MMTTSDIILSLIELKYTHSTLVILVPAHIAYVFSLFLFSFKKLGIYLLYNVVSVSAVQQNESAIRVYMHMCISPPS